MGAEVPHWTAGAPPAAVEHPAAPGGASTSDPRPGTSGFVMSMTNSLVQVLCNASLQHYGGDLYVGVMTVINSIREVVSMPVQGITNGCQPVLGYNYGAGEYERVRRGIRFTTVLTVGYSVAAWALVMAVPELLIRIFNDEPELIAAGIPAFRLYFAPPSFVYVLPASSGSRCSWDWGAPGARCFSPCCARPSLWPR